MRNAKLAEAIREEVSIVLRDDLKDPRVGFITITRVEVTGDCRYARIFFSIYGNKKNKDDAINGLNSAKGFLRKMLAERVKVKFVPEIEFKLDESAEYSIHMDEIFKKLEDERK